jgi:hypothetical protein
MNRQQRGATVVEFALVLLIFLMFLLGILDFSRMLFTWNAANEAARAGARFAVVCDDTNNQAQVLAKMQALLPQIDAIEVRWIPKPGEATCDHRSCQGVKVSIVSLDYRWISPIPGLISRVYTAPDLWFSSSLTREVMRQDPLSNTIFCP